MKEAKSSCHIIPMENRIRKYIKKSKTGERKQTLLFLGFLILISFIGRLNIQGKTEETASITAGIDGFNRENSLSVTVTGSLSLLPSPGKSVFNNSKGLQEVFNTSDLNILALEVPLLAAESSMDSSEKLLEELAQKGFGLLQVSGNGIYQQGLTGITATLSGLQEHNFQALGSGLTLEDAFSPYHMEKSAVKISILALNAFPPSGCEAGKNRLGTAYFNEDMLSPLITGLIRDGSQVIVTVSFREGTSFAPSSAERELARKLIDIGAKFVVGTGTGIVRETEHYKDGVIFYGLGDLTPKGCYSLFKETLLLKFFFYGDTDPEVMAFPLVLRKGEWAVINRRNLAEKLAAYKIFQRLAGHEAWENGKSYFILKPGGL